MAGIQSKEDPEVQQVSELPKSGAQGSTQIRRGFEARTHRAT